MAAAADCAFADVGPQPNNQLPSAMLTKPNAMGAIMKVLAFVVLLSAVYTPTAEAAGLQANKLDRAATSRVPIQSNICQTVCQNGRTIQVSCTGQQNCCANAITC